MERPDVPEDLRSCITRPLRTQRPPKRPCAIKKSMVDVYESIFPSQKGRILPLLVSTWAGLPIEEVEVVAVVNAEGAGVTAMMTTATAEVAAVGQEAAVVMAAVAVADHPLRITEVVHEGTIARDHDLTHLVAIDSV